jgi:hypothetical protein
MGWSDKAKSGGGSSTEGVIVDYTFMDEFPFGDGKSKKSDNDNIYLLLVIRPDGVEDGDEESYNKRSLYLGSGQYLRIEDEGKTLVSSDDEGTPRLYDQGEVFKFIESLEAAGFPAESRFPDPTEEKKINFEGMIGWRIRVVNEIDEEATKEYGKRKVTKGKHKGKEFNRTYTKVTKVFGEEEAPTKGGKSTKSTKSTKSAKDEDADEDNDTPTVSNKVADKFLLALIGAQPKEQIEKSALALAITRYAAKTKMDEDERNALRSHIVEDDYAYIDDAAEREVIEVSKKGVITAA